MVQAQFDIPQAATRETGCLLYKEAYSKNFQHDQEATPLCSTSLGKQSPQDNLLANGEDGHVRKTVQPLEFYSLHL